MAPLRPRTVVERRRTPPSPVTCEGLGGPGWVPARAGRTGEHTNWCCTGCVKLLVAYTQLTREQGVGDTPTGCVKHTREQEQHVFGKQLDSNQQKHKILVLGAEARRYGHSLVVQKHGEPSKIMKQASSFGRGTTDEYIDSGQSLKSLQTSSCPANQTTRLQDDLQPAATRVPRAE